MNALRKELSEAEAGVQRVRDKINEALQNPLSTEPVKKPVSMYRGKTWTAYKPGQDQRFPKNWVTRDEHGNLCACLASRKDLLANAKLCEVKLSWANKANGPTTG